MRVPKLRMERVWGFWPGMLDAGPLDLRLAGRVLLHAAVVGAGAGLLGAGFFASLEWLQRLLLEELAGYVPLRAFGEQFAAGPEVPHVFRPWLLLLLPLLGGLVCGWLSRYAPEVRGGGGDAMIDAFHRHGGLLRRRVLWIKPLASLATLSTGGAGGREGPTMQMGAALGSWVSRALGVGPRERRILLVAGVAAGMSAVFRTPLGAALLSVEVLYRDSFESDALVPSILAGVVAYSVVISLFGETTLFAHAARFPFVPAHLPLYALLALATSIAGILFLSLLRRSQGFFAWLPGPAWLKPAWGGLLLGLFAVPVLLGIARVLGHGVQGMGVLGGGYGAVQTAISGASWLPGGWTGVGLLLALFAAKAIGASLTLGSGGSAGDFAPSLALGGLLGGAFGRVAALLTGDARIDAGAFALVGMGTFYGGIAHVPLSALVLVCELARSYDLLVPLMLAQGIAFVLLGRRTLYHAQVLSQRKSPAHRDGVLAELLSSTRVSEVMRQPVNLVYLQLQTSAKEMLRHVQEAPAQELFLVLGESGKLEGVITAASVWTLALEREGADIVLAADLMLRVDRIRPDCDLRTATQVLVEHGLREIPVVDGEGAIVGLIGEKDLARIHLQAADRAETP